MDYKTFSNNIKAGQEPRSLYLKALYRDARGDWDAAHALVDLPNDRDACWIHAYLHREEGDRWNAGYWYRLAGKTFPEMSLAEEWEAMARYFLERGES